jgi:hypothetical protein
MFVSFALFKGPLTNVMQVPLQPHGSMYEKVWQSLPLLAVHPVMQPNAAAWATK